LSPDTDTEAVLRLATEEQQPAAAPQAGQTPGTEPRTLAFALPESSLGTEDLVDPETAVADTLLRSFDGAVADFRASSSLVAQLLAQPSVKELQGDISGRLAQAEALLQKQVEEKQGNLTARKAQVRVACSPAGMSALGNAWCWQCMQCVLPQAWSRAGCTWQL
jgi:hypothetical protein